MQISECLKNSKSRFQIEKNLVSLKEGEVARAKIEWGQ